jgi:hypothetical protein
MQGGAVAVTLSGYDKNGNISFGYCLFEQCYATPVSEIDAHIPVVRKNKEESYEHGQINTENSRLECGGAVYLFKPTYIHFSSCRFQIFLMSFSFTYRFFRFLGNQAYSRIGHDVTIDTPLKGSKFDISRYYSNFDTVTESALLQYYYNKDVVVDCCSISPSPRMVVHYEKDVNLVFSRENGDPLFDGKHLNMDDKICRIEREKEGEDEDPDIAQENDDWDEDDNDWGPETEKKEEDEHKDKDETEKEDDPQVEGGEKKVNRVFIIAVVVVVATVLVGITTIFLVVLISFCICKNRWKKNTKGKKKKGKKKKKDKMLENLDVSSDEKSLLNSEQDNETKILDIKEDKKNIEEENME